MEQQILELFKTFHNPQKIANHLNIQLGEVWTCLLKNNLVQQTEQDRQILSIYEQNKNGGLVAEQLKITNYKVYKCLEKYGIKINKLGGKEKNPVQVMINMYNSGKSIPQIAKILKMNESSIYERLTNARVKLRTKREAFELNGHTKIKSIDEQNVIKRFQQGESAQKIADGS